MKKFLLVAALLMMAATAWARPALSGAVKCVQPDGSTVMLVLHGDEYYHFSTTTDGYTVLQNENGAWEYARLDNNRLISTGVQAHAYDAFMPVFVKYHGALGVAHLLVGIDHLKRFLGDGVVELATLYVEVVDACGEALSVAPSFLYVLPNGLNDPEDPLQAGWAGYHQRGLCADSLTTAWKY